MHKHFLNSFAKFIMSTVYFKLICRTIVEIINISSSKKAATQIRNMSVKKKIFSNLLLHFARVD